MVSFIASVEKAGWWRVKSQRTTSATNMSVMDMKKERMRYLEGVVGWRRVLPKRVVVA